MKRVEYKQQIIGTDGRMLGEQGKERQYTSRRSGGKEQREIDSPKRFLPAYAVDGGGCGQYKKEQGGLHRGEAIGRLFRFFVAGYYYFLFIQYQRACFSFFVYNAGLVEVLLYIERYKHHQSAVDGFVGLAAHT